MQLPIKCHSTQHCWTCITKMCSARESLMWAYVCFKVFMYSVSLSSFPGSSQNWKYTMDSASITALGENLLSNSITIMATVSAIKNQHIRSMLIDAKPWYNQKMQKHKQTKLKTNTYMQSWPSPPISFYQIIILSQNSSSVWHDQRKSHWGGSRLKLTNGPQKPSAQHNHSHLDATLGGCSHAKGHISFCNIKMHLK